jgi:hypothetical protein
MIGARCNDNVDDLRADGRATLPLACTLGPDDGATQLQRWRELAARGRPVARRDRHQLEVRFKPGVSAELRALAAAEQRCCAFLTWTVTDTDGGPVLHVSATPESPDDLTTVADLFHAV